MLAGAFTGRRGLTVAAWLDLIRTTRDQVASRATLASARRQVSHAARPTSNAGPMGLAAVVLLIVLLVRLTLAERPLAGISLPLLGCAAALALYAGWVPVSASWS
jgi:hypothetical protein